MMFYRCQPFSEKSWENSGVILKSLENLLIMTANVIQFHQKKV